MPGIDTNTGHWYLVKKKKGGRLGRLRREVAACASPKGPLGGWMDYASGTGWGTQPRTGRWFSQNRSSGLHQGWNAVGQEIGSGTTRGLTPPRPQW
ncbi:hypothetical protein A2348_00795 [Candidatus Uhrbacteria bacterium RIFOXYB12_FULL_58_10]|nr:MAG: hypothetical protein A2348_00795 [Candidatus Uhrbacteria bacterium RIFOXYB12_FULL_58_10]OGL99916.1 MAG: hypothetical protein A2501_04810 [Candidatus Uhrbacteria bacterium RIFOXYC12_FULL_57_11]